MIFSCFKCTQKQHVRMHTQHRIHVADALGAIFDVNYGVEEPVRLTQLHEQTSPVLSKGHKWG